MKRAIAGSEAVLLPPTGGGMRWQALEASSCSQPFAASAFSERRQGVATDRHPSPSQDHASHPASLVRVHRGRPRANAPDHPSADGPLQRRGRDIPVYPQARRVARRRRYPRPGGDHDADGRVSDRRSRRGIADTENWIASIRDGYPLEKRITLQT
jgi:hypothetical protein